MHVISDAEAIASPHIARTERRKAAQPVALCIQDTSLMDFNGQDIEGLGPLQYEAQRPGDNLESDR